MPERNVNHLRDYLFDTLDRLSDKNLKGEALNEELERAKVIQATAGRIIETAKAQTDRLKVLGNVNDAKDNFLEGAATRKAITSESSS